MRAGSSVFAKFQNGNGSCGSAGALLKNSSDDSRWLLTANHVISRNRTPQRVLLDVPGPHELELGTEIRQVKVEAENNRVDAAVVKLTLDTAKFDGFFSPFGSTFGANLSAVDPAQYIGLIKNTPRRVSKVGMATVETHGVAKYVDAVVSIEMVEVGFEAAGFTDLLIVEDLDEIAVFAGGGDSGSLVVDDEPGNRRPVGILVARATKAPLSLVAFLKTTLSELEKTGTGPFELCRS